MKKLMFVLIFALFAMNFVNAQSVSCPVPRGVDVTCLPNDAIHPIAGTPYDYIVNVPTPPGTNTYNWFVTTDPNFLAGGVLTGNIEGAPGTYLAATGTGYNDPLTGTNTISLTWNSFVYDPATPVFVVIQVVNTSTDPGTCQTNNLKVYKIMPVNAFTLDIADINVDGTVAAYEATIDRCIHDVVSATYDPTAPEGVLYDYGDDTLFYVVTAANFSTSWLPSLQVSGLALMGEVTYVGWARPTVWPVPAGAYHDFTLAAGTYTAVDPVDVLDATGTVGAAGECIVIAVVIDHTTTANYEGLVAETITVAVDGKTQLTLATPLGDVHWSSTQPVANTDCGLEDGFLYDLAATTLRPRPDIQSATPAVPGPGNVNFLPVKP